MSGVFWNSSCEILHARGGGGAGGSTTGFVLHRLLSLSTAPPTTWTPCCHTDYKHLSFSLTALLPLCCISEKRPDPKVQSAGCRRVPPASYLKHLPSDIRIEKIHYKSTPHPIAQGTYQHPPTPTKTGPLWNGLHPVIRQINGIAWNVAFTSTKVKCCREGVAFRLWLVDYVVRNPLNASIIWWSCQFAVCALSAPQSLLLRPLTAPKPTLLCVDFWGGSEVGRGGDTCWKEGRGAALVPHVPTTTITPHLSLRSKC